MRHLAVFAKWPAPGRVKTRLSPALPAEQASALARALLEDTLAAARDAGAERRTVYWDGLPSAEEAARIAPGFEARDQRPGDLGARLERGFAEMLAAGGAAVVVGADLPGLGPADLDAAFRALAARDVVLGPTADGGYWLIGARAPAPELFGGIPWSTERVLAETLTRAAAAGRTVARLDERRDLDTPGDLVAWLATRVARPADGSRTDAALRAMKLLPDQRAVAPPSGSGRA